MEVSLKSIKRITSVLILCSIAGLGQPQEISLTLQQAVERALEKHPLIEIQRRGIERAQGQRTTAGLIPNPTLGYYREDLNLGPIESGEWIFSASLPLDFIWTRWPKMSAASARIEAERLHLANLKLQMTFELQKAYIETHFAGQIVQGWENASRVTEQALQAAQARFADGDLSGYDQQRIAVELQRYQNSATEAQISLQSNRRRLAFLLDPSAAHLVVQTTGNFPLPGAPDLSEERMLEMAKASRPDLQAAQAILRGRQSSLAAAKWDALPDVNALLGYKKQVDDFKGTVFQVNVNIPIFDRGQGEQRQARATLEQQIVSNALLEKHVELEVREAYAKFRFYQKQIESFRAATPNRPEQLLETVMLSYDEGEMSLLELLDGVRAYSASFETKNETLLKYQLSLFELEKAVAAPMTRN
jgi:cobalt-zinc-cadmium efflux system outer membrane protein